MSTSDTILITWLSPHRFLPDHALQLLSKDTDGGVTVRFVSVILCACLNGGTCLRDDSILSRARFDDNGHYKWPCNCSDFYGGSSCEIDMRGCGSFSTCPEPSMCRNEPSLPSGYACDQCPSGFELVDNKCTGKCSVTQQLAVNNSELDHCCHCCYTDVNECASSTSCADNEVCTNTEGSHQCSCASGYSRNPGNMMCEGKSHSYHTFYSDTSEKRTIWVQYKIKPV